MNKFKWVVEFEVDEVWVADGFNLTKERAEDMIFNDLGYADVTEIKVKILKSPDKNKILKAQGYNV